MIQITFSRPLNTASTSSFDGFGGAHLRRLELRRPSLSDWLLIALAAANFIILGYALTFVVALLAPWVFCTFERDRMTTPT